MTFRNDIVLFDNGTPNRGKRKRCGSCFKWKTRSLFGKSKNTKDGLWRYCLQCERLRTARIKRTPQAEKKVKQRRMSKYRLSDEEFDRLKDRQAGLCAICGRPETRDHGPAKFKRLAIDHCHATGKVRGLLCQECNIGLGLFRDDCAIMEAAVAYLRRHAP
jgi:Recombination endonuclease VII